MGHTRYISPARLLYVHTWPNQAIELYQLLRIVLVRWFPPPLQVFAKQPRRPACTHKRRTRSRMAQPTALVLGTGVDGTTPCVLLEDGPHRLLLNATEGLQRLAGEHRLKLHRGLDAVLLSSLEPTAVAGLPGLLLTLAQAGVARLHVCGPPGTAAYLSTLRPFARTGTMAVQASSSSTSTE